MTKEQKVVHSHGPQDIIQTINFELLSGWFVNSFHVDPTERFSFIVFERFQVTATEVIEREKNVGRKNNTASNSRK